MASLTFARFGPRSARLEATKVTDVDTSAVYNLTSIAYVETYDDVEFVTATGIHFRQDDATLCKAARDTHDREARVLKEAVEEATKKNEAAKATASA